MTRTARTGVLSAISGDARQISTELRVFVRSGSAATTYKYGSVGDASRDFLTGVAKQNISPSRVVAYSFRENSGVFAMERFPSEASLSCAISSCRSFDPRSTITVGYNLADYFQIPVHQRARMPNLSRRSGRHSFS